VDQRNAGGQSHAPVSAQDGWDSYTSDHIAVLDHLKIDKCHVFGQCIGGSFIFNMLKKHPQRVAAAIIAQPIGRTGPLKPGRPPRFIEWAKGLTPTPSDAVQEAFYNNLYGAGFVYSTDRAFVASVKHPVLLLAGNDDAHPRDISDECAKLLPNMDEYILEWKAGDAVTAAQAKCKAFLAKHTPR
jgi:pimeloyl-ACP methyl ester carboxylesterase